LILPIQIARGVSTRTAASGAVILSRAPIENLPASAQEAAHDLVPLIAIVFANEIGNTLPISAVDCVKEMFCVKRT
jgi:hypothetical protein